MNVAPVIYVVFLETEAGTLPYYVADAPPDEEAMKDAVPGLQTITWARAILRHD